MGVLVIDIGTSGLRAGLVRHDGTLHYLNYEACRPDTPTPGLVEFDAQKLAEAALRVCNLTIEQSRKTDKIVAVGITNQRASTVIWSELDAMFSVCSYALTDCTKILPTQCGPKWLAC
ncbi:MAG: FGGY family carbohydrate kinase [Acidimicrobiaceae bacterium]